MDRLQNFQEAAPGLFYGSTNRFQELYKCLFSDCDSWVLKFEMVLIHASFLFGYVTPRCLIWRLIKHLLALSSSKLEDYFKGVEVLVITAMSLFEQIGLTYIWDSVRDSSICMRFNNCDNDFLAQISNIKMKMCNVTNTVDDMRKLSICEKLFNDSPLILMSTGMLLLSVYTSSKFFKTYTPPPSMIPDNINPPPPKTGPNNAPQVANFPQSSIGPSFFSDYQRKPGQSSSQTSSSGAANQPRPQPQTIRAACPKCNKRFVCNVPKPWPLCCDNSLPFQKKGKNKKNNYQPKNGSSCGGGSESRSTHQNKDDLSSRVVKDLFKNIKCRHCREQLAINLQAAAILKKEEQKKLAK